METSNTHPSYDLDYLLNKFSLHTGNSDPTENYQYLKVVFDVIRQNTSFEEAIKFNDMLPLPFKAIFLDGWHISYGTNPSLNNINQLAEMMMAKSGQRLSNAAEARQLLRKVFAFLGQLTSPSQIKEGLSFLPEEFRSLVLQDPGFRYAYSDTCIWLS